MVLSSTWKSSSFTKSSYNQWLCCLDIEVSGIWLQETDDTFLWIWLCVFTAACNFQFGCQKADMKFLGRDHFETEILKVKPLRVMPKGLRTTWPLSIALPEIWPNPSNWAIFDAMQRKATARVVSRTYCFFWGLLDMCLHFNRLRQAPPMPKVPCAGGWLATKPICISPDFLDPLGHIQSLMRRYYFVCVNVDFDRKCKLWLGHGGKSVIGADQISSASCLALAME